MSALIVTAELGATDFAWLDGLRRIHFPPDRNQLPAHLTMFHALPPSALDEVKRQLSIHAAASQPSAFAGGLMNLGGGVAIRVVSDELDAIRDSIADHFHGLLSAQDSAGWRPHVTIQNKVPARQAKALYDEIEAGFRPRPLAIAGLGLHRYLGGPWEPLATYTFKSAK